MSDDTGSGFDKRQRIDLGATQEARSAVKGAVQGALDAVNERYEHDRRRRDVGVDVERRHRDDPRFARAEDEGVLGQTVDGVIKHANNPIAVVGLIALAAVAYPIYQGIFTMPELRRAIDELSEVQAELVRTVHSSERNEVLGQLREAINAQGGTHWRQNQALEDLQDAIDELRGVQARRRNRFPDGDSRLGTTPEPPKFVYPNDSFGRQR